MTRDANQIAKEYVRRHEAQTKVSGRLPEFKGVPPRRGTLTLRSQPGDEGVIVDEWKHVTVNLLGPGGVVLRFKDDTDIILYPQPGWLLLFEPDEGE